MCYAFSLPPTAFTRQLNRATAESAQDTAATEGLAPLLLWVKRLADHVIQDLLGHADLEFAWGDARPADPAEQAKVVDTYVRAGVYAVNEARALLGLDPVPGGERPMVYGAQGAVPLGAPNAAKLRSFASLRKYDPDEPRIPQGETGGGEWTDGSTGDRTGSSSKNDDTGGGAQVAEDQTCQDFIAENCNASILRVFPGQFLGVPVGQVLEAAKAGDSAARTAKKLLFDNRYRK